MDNTIKPLVELNIDKYNINPSFSQLSNIIQNQLIEIENFFQKYTKEQIKLSELLKNQKINLAKVCISTTIPRSSVYNSPNVLKKYINERINEIEKNDLFDIKKAQKNSEDYELLKKYIEHIKIQIIETDIFELKIQELEKEIKDLNHINKQYAFENATLRNENENIKFQLVNKKSNVINFNNHSQ
ncbi:hypothetical protein [Rummeliibacillus pycnus]|uniref:hypothetical protein n=1 Tax=Rummeliibacillus pycnus TaxID=101070 RepID=UPI000C9BF651|nr:hypothetical protein [Rummeliibacillus pycnus]